MRVRAWKGKIPSSYPKMVEFLWICLAWPNWPIVIGQWPCPSQISRSRSKCLIGGKFLVVGSKSCWGILRWQCGSVGVWDAISWNLKHSHFPLEKKGAGWLRRRLGMFTYSGGGTIVLGIRKTRVHSRLGMIMRSFSPACIIADMKRAADDGKPFAKLLFWLQTVVFPPNRVMQKKPSVLHKWKVILPVIGWPVQRNLK